MRRGCGRRAHAVPMPEAGTGRADRATARRPFQQRRGRRRRWLLCHESDSSVRLLVTADGGHPQAPGDRRSPRSSRWRGRGAWTPRLLSSYKPTPSERRRQPCVRGRAGPSGRTPGYPPVAELGSQPILAKIPLAARKRGRRSIAPHAVARTRRRRKAGVSDRPSRRPAGRRSRGPRCWRQAGLVRSEPRDVSPHESRAVTPSRAGRGSYAPPTESRSSGRTAGLTDWSMTRRSSRLAISVSGGATPARAETWSAHRRLRSRAAMEPRRV
jgi:hypothetical protein